MVKKYKVSDELTLRQLRKEKARRDAELSFGGKPTKKDIKRQEMIKKLEKEVESSNLSMFSGIFLLIGGIIWLIAVEVTKTLFFKAPPNVNYYGVFAIIFGIILLVVGLIKSREKEIKK